jgi:uncharacterized repeat protein (TIGR03843 family)
MHNPLAAAILETLQHGEIDVKGRFLWGSNYTLLAEVAYHELKLQAVYKPTRGERPLWDFPSASLAHRETAAYLLCRALGWDMVPETVYRRQAPAGAGSLQRYVDHDPERHYFNFDDDEHERLRPVALFDVIVNNADRKGGHILMDESGQIRLIDHGLCFHVDDKLRTVVWDFAGKPIPDELLQISERLLVQLEPNCDLTLELEQHLSRGELRALRRRLHWLLEDRRFPNPDAERRPYPWPPV